MDEDEQFEQIKRAVLEHIEKMFAEMEEEMAMSHQEKYALLEDAFESASDTDELRVAFERWYHDHSDEVEFDHSHVELWDHAMTGNEE
jgi:DNA-binding transcriptional regulator/RsmH inhibitor MraZ